MDNIVWFWIILGIVLIIAELVTPGMVVVFLGISALIVAAGVQLDLLSSWPAMLSAWLGCSLLTVTTLRQVMKRFLSGSTEKGSTDEDLDAFGLLVKVVQVDPQDPCKGRIAFRGTTWEAECLDDALIMGAEVRLIQRENLIWIVEEA